MTEADRIGRTIGEALPRIARGSLRFWGSWFGGRPHDNLHQIVECHAEGELLTIGFDGGEILRVWNPRDAVVREKRLVIGDASRVRWEWFYYGRPQIPANLRFEDFTVDGSEIRTDTNVDRYSSALETDRSLPAVELVSL